MDWSRVFEWVMGGGLLTMIGFAVKAGTELRKMKVDAATTKAEVEAQRAREAQFDASIAESSTKVAGEGILKGLLVTLTQREQHALQQLADERGGRAAMLEQIAELKEQEGRCQAQLKAIQDGLLNTERLHSAQLRALQDRIVDLNDRIYSMGQRMIRAGGAFTATDVVPDHDSSHR